MVMVNGRRADLEMRTQWSRNLRAGKDLDYENQLSMLNALNIVCEEYVKVCEQLRVHDTRWGLVAHPFAQLQALAFSYEISGLMDEQKVYRVVCEIAGTLEQFDERSK